MRGHLPSGRADGTDAQGQRSGARGPLGFRCLLSCVGFASHLHRCRWRRLARFIFRWTIVGRVCRPIGPRQAACPPQGITQDPLHLAVGAAHLIISPALHSLPNGWIDTKGILLACHGDLNWKGRRVSPGLWWGRASKRMPWESSGDAPRDKGISAGGCARPCLRQRS